MCFKGELYDSADNECKGYGSSAGEKGVQHILLFTAEKIARECNLNVNLVRFLQKYLNMNRKLLVDCSFANSGKVVDEIMKCAKSEYETSYRLLPDTIPSPVPQNIKAEIEKDLLEYIDYFEDVNAAIYESIM